MNVKIITGVRDSGGIESVRKRRWNLNKRRVVLTSSVWDIINKVYSGGKLSYKIVK